MADLNRKMEAIMLVATQQQQSASTALVRTPRGGLVSTVPASGVSPLGQASAAGSFYSTQQNGGEVGAAVHAAATALAAAQQATASGAAVGSDTTQQAENGSNKRGRT